MHNGKALKATYNQYNCIKIYKSKCGTIEEKELWRDFRGIVGSGKLKCHFGRKILAPQDATSSLGKN